ncbi:MAG TPA: hypothetical protein VG028_13405 [Terriglobia bacterium]|nr:hypothetical protein [Terriglobia bacterium]
MKSFVWIFLLGFIGLIIYEVNSEKGNSPPEQVPVPQHKLADADIQVGSYELEIANADTNDWPPLIIYLNGSPPWAFHATIPSLAAGQKINVSLRSFAKDDGLRFDPSNYKVTELWIGGGSYDFRKYGF